MERKRTPKLARVPPSPDGSLEAWEVASDAIDSRRLLQAIQTLDNIRGCAKPSLRQVRGVLQAWAYFLGIATRLDDTKGVERQRIVLILESRVLSCVERFIHGELRQSCAALDDTEPRDVHWSTWTCSQSDSLPHGATGCVGAVIKTTAMCFLFFLARHTVTATLVVRTRLHRCLLGECSFFAPPQHVPSRDEESMPCDVDATDLLLGVDPFDWSTRALTDTMQQEELCRVFLLPIGHRSLIWMLQGHRLPQNEAEEVAIQLTQEEKACASVRSVSSPSKKRYPRHLPSIFSFPTQSSHENDEPCVVCAPKHDSPIWLVAKQHLTCLHFAVRALVAIAVLLPRKSHEYKTFLRDGARQTLQSVAHHPSPIQPQRVNPGSELGRINPQSDDSTDQDGARDFRLILSMALAGHRLLATHEREASVQPQMTAEVVLQGNSTTLYDRLRAVSNDKQHAIEMQRRERLEREHTSTREHLRKHVFELLSNAQEVRLQLVRSLALMTTGREHPAGHNQSIVDWLGSFTTIEMKERVRRDQEELRQRRLVKLQYQTEEQKRREKDERACMQRNDFDIPDILERTREQIRREEFLKLQQELRELQAKEDEERLKAEETVRQKKREAAVEELRRQQAMLEDRRRQQRECDWMKREDTYYATKIIREQQQREYEAAMAKQIDPIAEQQKRIEKMRQADREKKRVNEELESMRMEDLFARQRRFLEAAMRKEEAEREWKARRQMEAEERFLREQWKRLDAELVRKNQEAERRRRAEEKRQRRDQERQWREWQAAWVTAYDAYGNVYFYNQLTGESQWESPLASSASWSW